MKNTIVYSGESFEIILQEFEKNGKSKRYIKLDEDDYWNGFDLIFDKLQISSLKTEKIDDYGTRRSTFVCGNESFKPLLKLIRSLKYLGDGGHSFSVKINDVNLGWDGDGNDRVKEINGVEIKSGVKDFDSKIKDLMKTVDNNIHESLGDILYHYADKIKI